MRLIDILLIVSCVAALSYAQTTGTGTTGQRNNGGMDRMMQMMFYSMMDNPFMWAMTSGMMGGGGMGMNSFMPFLAWNTMM